MEIIKIRATKYQITIADLLELIIIHGETCLIARLKLTRPLNDCYVQLFNSATTCDIHLKPENLFFFNQDERSIISFRLFKLRIFPINVILAWKQDFTLLFSSFSNEIMEIEFHQPTHQIYQEHRVVHRIISIRVKNIRI